MSRPIRNGNITKILNKQKKNIEFWIKKKKGTKKNSIEIDRSTRKNGKNVGYRTIDQKEVKEETEEETDKIKKKLKKRRKDRKEEYLIEETRKKKIYQE